MKVVARSVKVEVVGEIVRCNEGESSKFYCLRVRIHFDNGKVVDYLLKSHKEKKGLENFLQNKKGLKERLERSFLLDERGRVIFDYKNL